MLTGLSRFWFAQTGGHRPQPPARDGPRRPAAGPGRRTPGAVAELRGRMMIGRLADVLPVECVVRGYLSGLGLEGVPRRRGEVCGIPLPPGCARATASPRRCSRPRGRRPPATHDENIPFARVQAAHRRRARGRASARRRSRSTRAARRVCERAGIILADTKFEFGVLPSGELLLIDEALTPDSSRFWDAAAYEPGRAQASYDKQFVRDWLEAQPWDKTAPGPGAARRRRRRHARPVRRGLRADHRGRLRPLSRGGRHRPMSDPVRAWRFAVNVTPKPGILDPQGRAVERSLPHLGIEGVTGGPRRAGAWSSPWPRTDEAAARAIVERLAGELLSNPLIEAFEVEALGDGRRPLARGSPGDASASASSCSRARTGTSTRATRSTIAGAEPVDLWHESRRPRRRGRRAAPGRLRVRRLPAGGRHRPVQPGHAARSPTSPPAAGRCSGSATGSRSSPRPGSSRARCCATAACGSCAARSRCCPSTSTRRSPARSTSGGRCACPSRTARAATTPTTRRSTPSSATAASCGATRPPTARSPGRRTPATPTGRCGGSRASGTPRATSPGSCRTRRRRPRRCSAPTTGSAIIRSLVVSSAEWASTGSITGAGARRRAATGGVAMTATAPAAVPLHRALGLEDVELDAIRERLGREPERPRARDVQRHVERALLVQEQPPAAPHAAHRRAATSSPGSGSRPGSSRSGTGWRSRSRSRATTTRARSSRTRAPRPASAGSCATCSRWAPARSPSSTRCASATRRTRGRATSSTASSAGSAGTATASACRRSAASSCSTRRTRATRS